MTDKPDITCSHTEAYTYISIGQRLSLRITGRVEVQATIGQGWQDVEEKDKGEA